MCHSASLCRWQLCGSCRNESAGQGEATAERCMSCQHYSGPARGMGDILHRITSATGVAWAAAKVAEATTGSTDCGCEQRRQALNRALPLVDRGTQEQ